ncbi:MULTISPECIES: haloacid dehalogenase-like hydrolase [unclassified Variovorax]|uniref:haloacid dehalogenase-like hydrolase n=1 Tax=unclassified Variovorax TaxID=663243 RepID=UPI00088B49A6|nr:haloacid dehalogenase-like hydrolase [Variovorax sp. CF079]SDE10536.1 haloacid dehalogenase-like hydrolase [Variovorax sp. CF079]
MKRNFARVLPMVLAAALAAGCAGGPFGAAAPSASIQPLAAGRWDPFNRQQIDALIAGLGRGSPAYNASKPPYVVFDWDNTSIFLDIEEASLIYQLENLAFGATPAQLETALRKNIPKTNFAPAHNNAAGQPVNIDSIVPDIVASYTWLYRNYSGLQGSMPLAAVKQNPNYTAFVTKVRYLYEAIGDTFDHDTAYPWVTYLFVGLNEAQVRKLTADTVAWQLKQPVEKVKWSTPAALPGQAGVVSVSWKNGLRLVPEMQELYARFRNAGFDVWVCSASFVDVIKEISSNPAFGYDNPAERVLAMELERDAKGVIQPEYRRGYDQTQGRGKTKNIQRFLVSKYGYGPSFIAGDSEGDQNMMADFADTKKVLIVNRLRDGKTDIGKFSVLAAQGYGKADTRYLLQGRDDNTGLFVPSQLHTPLGATQGKTLK